MYVGGIPENDFQLPDSVVCKKTFRETKYSCTHNDNLLQSIQAFKGCMQGFIVNHQEEELISEKAIRHKVGQCFPQVEKGSFFPGDAYAIYSKFLK